MDFYRLNGKDPIIIDSNKLIIACSDSSANLLETHTHTKRNKTQPKCVIICIEFWEIFA